MKLSKAVTRSMGFLYLINNPETFEKFELLDF